MVSGIALAAAPARALAHVAPAQDQNNRYIKVLPFGDRVRIAYTVFYGQGPGHAMRRMLDADGDGIVSDSEAHAYGVQLGAQVAAGLDVEVDGVRWPVRWDEISVGLGVPDVSAGAWSVDLIAWPCSAGGGGGGGVHHLLVRDRYDLPIGGETELWVLDMPSITIDRARIGGMDDPTHDFQFSGPPIALAHDGLELTYTADAHAGRGSAGACTAGTPEEPRGSRLGMIGAALVGGLIGIGAMLWTRRHKRSRAR